MTSALEQTFLLYVRGSGLPLPVKEHLFCPGRKWRWDFCWPDKKLAVEIEGGIWTGGRHVRGIGFNADCDKSNEAMRLGWKVLRFTSDHLTYRAAEVIDLMKHFLKKESHENTSKGCKSKIKSSFGPSRA